MNKQTTQPETAAHSQNDAQTFRYTDHVKNVSSVFGFVPNHEYDKVVAQRDELLAEVSNLKHDYEIVSTERNNLRSVMNNARRWIAGHMAVSGITDSKKAEQIIAAIAKVEGSK